MELVGLKRYRKELEDRGVTVKSLTTDRHIQITAYMKKEWSTVKHYFDRWHIAKGTVYSYHISNITIEKQCACKYIWLDQHTNTVHANLNAE